MNFLALCKRVNDLVGYQGVVTSVDAPGYQKVLINAVKDAWEDIQRYRGEWDFLRATKSVNVVPGTNYYSLEDFWGLDTPDLSTWLYVRYDYDRLTELSYDAYTGMDFSTSAAGRPRYYAIDPATNGMHISPVGDTYSLDIYYISKLQELANNTDVPTLPEKFHMAIVYGAVLKLATFTGNISLFDTYAVKYSEIMGQLMRAENPPKFVRKRPIA